MRSARVPLCPALELGPLLETGEQMGPTGASEARMHPAFSKLLFYSASTVME